MFRNEKVHANLTVNYDLIQSGSVKYCPMYQPIKYCLSFAECIYQLYMSVSSLLKSSVV